MAIVVQHLRPGPGAAASRAVGAMQGLANQAQQADARQRQTIQDVSSALQGNMQQVLQFVLAERARKDALRGRSEDRQFTLDRDEQQFLRQQARDEAQREFQRSLQEAQGSREERLYGELLPGYQREKAAIELEALQERAAFLEMQQKMARLSPAERRRAEKLMAEIDQIAADEILDSNQKDEILAQKSMELEELIERAPTEEELAAERDRIWQRNMRVQDGQLLWWNGDEDKVPVPIRGAAPTITLPSGVNVEQKDYLAKVNEYEKRIRESVEEAKLALQNQLRTAQSEAARLEGEFMKLSDNDRGGNKGRALAEELASANRHLNDVRAAMNELLEYPVAQEANREARTYFDTVIGGGVVEGDPGMQGDPGAQGFDEPALDEEQQVLRLSPAMEVKVAADMEFFKGERVKAETEEEAEIVRMAGERYLEHLQETGGVPVIPPRRFLSEVRAEFAESVGAYAASMAQERLRATGRVDD